MNKIYDKLLLALAILALLVGVGFYLTSTPGSNESSEIEFNAGDSPYVSLARPTSNFTDGAWPEAEEQAPGELFDVFTPPKIYIDQDGVFVFVQPKNPNAPEAPFGIYLASIEREPYRIQLEGYIEEDLKDSSKSLLLLFDEERQESIRARIGQEKTASAFKVLEFSIVKNRDAFNNITKVAKATILDQRSGETVVLTHAERLYEEGVTITVRSKENPEVEITLEKVGDSFETPAGNYTLTEINLEESSITVEKKGSEDEETRVATLKVTEASPKTTPTATETTPTSSEAPPAAFDFNF